MGKLKSLSEGLEDAQSQLKKCCKEIETAGDATTRWLCSMKDDLDRVNKQTRAELDRIDTDLRSQIRAIDAKGEDLYYNFLDKHLKNEAQQQKIEMRDMRKNLGDLEAIVSKHEKEVAALQATNITELPNRVTNLKKEIDF